jgi:hypothetical protein
VQVAISFGESLHGTKLLILEKGGRNSRPPDRLNIPSALWRLVVIKTRTIQEFVEKSNLFCDLISV